MVFSKPNDDGFCGTMNNRMLATDCADYAEKTISALLTEDDGRRQLQESDFCLAVQFRFGRPVQSPFPKVFRH
jgi:hypothetical protein